MAKTISIDCIQWNTLGTSIMVLHGTVQQDDLNLDIQNIVKTMKKNLSSLHMLNQFEIWFTFENGNAYFFHLLRGISPIRVTPKD